MNDYTFEIVELQRHLANLIRIGVVSEADYSGAIPRARIQIGELLTTWLPILSLRAGNDVHWWPVEVGEQVVVISQGGELSQGVVIGSIHQNAHSANADTAALHRMNYADGAVIEYDREQHHLNAVLPDGATTQLISNGGVQITGDITVIGNIKATGNVTDHTRSMQADRGIYNGHIHSGVSSGQSSTKVPEQQQ